MNDRWRKRSRIGVGVLVTIGCGLVCRRGLPFALGEHLGNFLWGVLWTLIVWFAAPSARPARIASIAAGVVFGIELFQLTPWPAQWSGRSVIAGYLVGGVFEWHDLVGGAAGVIAGTVAAARIGAKG